MWYEFRVQANFVLIALSFPLVLYMYMLKLLYTGVEDKPIVYKRKEKLLSRVWEHEKRELTGNQKQTTKRSPAQPITILSLPKIKTMIPKWTYKTVWAQFLYALSV